jgi:signal transduction histidine kinase
VSNESFSGSDDVIGGRQLIKQALLNFLTNAVRFTELGSIVIRAKQVNEDSQNVQIRFEIEDSGIGIAVEDQFRLFSIFEQVDNSSTRKHGGLGVGLAMTKKIAQLMHGDAGCYSRLGEGSTFWFTARLMKI